jgi:hypothetical protein
MGAARLCPWRAIDVAAEAGPGTGRARAGLGTEYGTSSGEVSG